MIYDIDPRSVAELVAKSHKEDIKAWFGELAQTMHSELEGYRAHNDTEQIMEIAVRELAAPTELPAGWEAAQMWYERGWLDTRYNPWAWGLPTTKGRQ